MWIMCTTFTSPLLLAILPLVEVDYVNASCKAAFWVKEVAAYDVGRELEYETEDPGDRCRVSNLSLLDISDRLFIPPLVRRQTKKKEGGVFRGWKVVVLLEDARQKEVYRRMLELGGAEVHRWTLKHLLDSQEKLSPQFKSLTHVVTQPGMILQDHFRRFIAANDQTAGGPSVVS